MNLMTDTDRKSVSKEEIKAWFDSGPITEEMLSFWLEIINQNKEP
jgi:hypothetical protein